MPPALPSMIRVVKHGYRAEPKLLWASLAMTALEALPDVLVGIWLALITDGLVHHHETRIYVGALGLAVSATLMWALSVTLDRTTRRLGDRLNIMFQGRVARLQAEVATVEHHERPVYLDRIAVLRTGVFALDHLFRSMFTMVGWLLRLAFVCVLLAAIHPALLLLLVTAVPLLLVAVWRPKIEKRIEEEVASHGRLGRHLFTVATSTSPGKEVRVTGNQADLVSRRRTAWGSWFAPIRVTNLASAAWLSLAWAVFSARVRRCRRLGRDRARPRPGRGGPRADGRRPALGVRRVRGGRARLPARHLARLGATTRLARGLRGRAERPRRPFGARPAHRRHPVRGRLVHLPRYDARGAARRRSHPPGRQRRRGGRRERRREVDPGQAPGPDVRADVGPRDRRRCRHRPDRRRGVARAPGRRLPGLRPPRVRRRDHRRARRPTAPRRPGRGGHRGRPGRGDTGGRRPPRRTRHPARALVGERSRRQLRSMAEAGSRPRLHAARAAAAPARRADRCARCGDRARAVRAVRRERPRGDDERPGHGPGLTPVLDGADGRSDRGPGRGAGRRGRQPRGPDRPAPASTPSCTPSRPVLTPDPRPEPRAPRGRRFRA